MGWSGWSVFFQKIPGTKIILQFLGKKIRKNARPWPGCCNFANFRNNEELFCSSQITSMQKLSYTETLKEKANPFFPAINKTLACARTSDLREGMLEYCFSASIHKRMVFGTPFRQFCQRTFHSRGSRGAGILGLTG